MKIALKILAGLFALTQFFVAVEYDAAEGFIGSINDALTS